MAGLISTRAASMQILCTTRSQPTVQHRRHIRLTQRKCRALIPINSSHASRLQAQGYYLCRKLPQIWIMRGVCRPNVWPSEELPELREAFREMGQLMIRVGTLLAQLCDCYIRSKNAEISPGALTRVISESPNPKGRLLHYFPPTDASKEGRNNWCAQHTDHGSLTGQLLHPLVYSTCPLGFASLAFSLQSSRNGLQASSRLSTPGTGLRCLILTELPGCTCACGTDQHRRSPLPLPTLPSRWEKPCRYLQTFDGFEISRAFMHVPGVAILGT